MNRVSGKVAIVTGAGSGIGKGIAELLIQEGARVILTDINVEAGADVARQLGDKATFMEHDVSAEQDWDRVIADTSRQFERLDILVNNAGIANVGLIEVTSLESWRTVMTVNLESVFLGVKYAIESMKKRGGGSIVNISSVGGIIGTSRNSAYSASKAGVKLLSKCAALECAELGYNIRVNSVHPGLVETPPCDEVLRQIGEGDIEAGKQVIMNKHPIGRMGHVSDIAQGVIYLASDESSFVTGTELIIDGGFTAQ